MAIFDPAIIYAAFLIFVRISSVIMTAPFLGSAFFPSRVKMFFALAVTVVVLPTVPVAEMQVSANPKNLEVLLGITQEILIGVLMGLIGIIIFGGVQLAGQFVSIQTGLGFANIVDPQSQVQNPAISQVLTLLGIILFLAIHGDHVYLRAMVQTFHVIPIGTAQLSLVAPELIRIASQIFVIGVQLSAPFIVVLFLLDLAFAIFARIMPQANIFFIALPLKVFGGLVMLLLIVPKLEIAFNHYFRLLFDYLESVLSIIAP